MQGREGPPASVRLASEAPHPGRVQPRLESARAIAALAARAPLDRQVAAEDVKARTQPGQELLALRELPRRRDRQPHRVELQEADRRIRSAGVAVEIAHQVHRLVVALVLHLQRQRRAPPSLTCAPPVAQGDTEQPAPVIVGGGVVDQVMQLDRGGQPQEQPGLGGLPDHGDLRPHHGPEVRPKGEPHPGLVRVREQRASVRERIRMRERGPQHQNTPKGRPQGKKPTGRSARRSAQPSAGSRTRASPERAGRRGRSRARRR